MEAFILICTSWLDLTEDRNSRCGGCPCREHTGVPAICMLLLDEHTTLLEKQSSQDSAMVPPGLPTRLGGHLCIARPLGARLGASLTPAHGNPQMSSKLLCVAPKLGKLTRSPLPLVLVILPRRQGSKSGRGGHRVL